MEIKRSHWEKEFTLDKVPLWTCPFCNQGQLFGNKDTIQVNESENSKKLRDDISWEPIWVSGSFGGVLKCINPHCRESTQILGEMITYDETDYNEYGDQTNIYYTQYLLPSAFFPTLHIFPIHVDVPEKIKIAIIETFKLYWIDLASCANKIRTVVEFILDEQNIPKTGILKKKKKKKESNLSLNDRIELFKKEKPEEAGFMMAIKWIGNEGSHNLTTLKQDDVLNAYEMLDHVIIKLYEKDPEYRLKILLEKAKTINETKKPISHIIKKQETDKSINGIIKESGLIIIEEF